MIRLEQVGVRFPLPDGGAVEALAGVDLEVRRGESLCLIGGSGCGKTTTLRLMNRLLDPTSGRVLVDGQDVVHQDRIALRRRMGYVVQQGALFPHLTVRGNVGLLCRLEGWDAARTRRRVDELLEMVRLDPVRFGASFPSELSGGQRQRVGVARALALDPPIVLLDEPFGALDPITRRELQQEFVELRTRQERTQVIVTHDLAEAFLLGDRVALMRRGRIEQVGSPEALRETPASEYVERFVAHQLAAPEPA
ncbi:MAG TPA: ATP-binding cassette domain-containing protein [Planctomycetota bacterium]|nr:ATP-binding cassette domain-containing protein [Planctomycetota bacterium]